MWYVGSKGQGICRSEDVVYLDGTRPAFASAVPRCHACGGSLSPCVLKRCFDEDVDAGFDVEKAAKNGEQVNPVGTPDPVMVALLLGQRNVARWMLVGATILFTVIVIAVLTR